MSVKITKSEYEFESKMATEKGLVDLGKQQLLKFQCEQEIINNKNKVVKYLNSDKLNNKNKVVITFRKYIVITEKEITELTKNNKQLKDSYDDLNEEYENSNNEIEELNEEKEQLEKQYNNDIRIYKNIIDQYKSDVYWMSLCLKVIILLNFINFVSQNFVSQFRITQ